MFRRLAQSAFLDLAVNEEQFYSRLNLILALVLGIGIPVIAIIILIVVLCVCRKRRHPEAPTPMKETMTVSITRQEVHSPTGINPTISVVSNNSFVRSSTRA